MDFEVGLGETMPRPIGEVRPPVGEVVHQSASGQKGELSCELTEADAQPRISGGVKI